MKTLLSCSVITLVLFATQVWAQSLEIDDAVVTDKTSLTDPAKAVRKAEGQWLAFSMPVLPGTHSPCCWKGNWNNASSEVGCSLENKHQSYGTRSDSPIDANVIVFSEIKNGRVNNIRVVGESCPVTGEGAKVIWIGNVDEEAGLDWLVSEARSDDSTLYALGLHRSDAANDHLYQLAIEKNGDVSEEAIFWLGEARGEAGSKILMDLATNAQTPREVRRQALFWLAHSDDDKTVAALADLLSR